MLICCFAACNYTIRMLRVSSKSPSTASANCSSAQIGASIPAASRLVRVDPLDYDAEPNGNGHHDDE